ncbi:hypothetical protein FBY30_2747 [Arthrobacter sp. SLBN-83]|uniref:DUF7426 family protein n=1 Tax=Arthrobacter sp. SLBN-83 TaxID=2768449 RepID=UPI00114FD1B6|nr:hypothetical protein [Arthrobacter sp. SLBN-83]TQJ60479.1 hypothetical protein FBY30_2747 [Arthrobacter sp. SLBN-83]
MTELKELNDFLSPTLVVPAGGKEYRIKAVSAKTGLRIQHMMTLGFKAQAGESFTEKDIELVSDDEETDFFRSVLGDTYDELLADGVSYAGLRQLTSLVTIWTTQSFEAAQQYFLAAGKAPEPNRAQRRTATRTSTAAATTTPKRASASGTSTPKRAKATPGSKSSPTGA